MPIYDYLCQKCGAVIERMHPSDAKREYDCKCGGVMVKCVSACSSVMDYKYRFPEEHRLANEGRDE